MIERISGQLLQKSPTFCIIDCHGVGIGLFISVNTFQKLGDENTEAKLLTHLHVREDAMQLYGFGDADEREMFRQLNSVSGIGPRLALTILSGRTVQELVQAITMEDYQYLVKIPGVGKKTAQRVVLELKEKVGVPADVEEAGIISGSTVKVQGVANEAILALVTLGYRQNEAKKAIDKVVQKNSHELPLEVLIKLALKEI